MASPSHEELTATLRERLQTPDGQVEADLIKGGEQLDEACLRRWLRADNWQLDKAEKRLRAHAKWRVTIAPNGRVDESEVRGELDADKVFLQGVDKHGRPCIVVTGANHIVSQRDVEECKRCIYYSLDRACEQVDYSENPDGQLCVIFDLQGLGYKNLDATILRAVFDVLANHYPERMGVLFMYDAPTIFWGLWKVVSPFIEVETRRKVLFVDSTDPAQLHENFDLEELPEVFGGKAKLVPIEETAKAFLAAHGSSNANASSANGISSPAVPA